MFRSKGPERGAVWRQVDKPTETQGMCVSVCVCLCVSHTPSCSLSTTVFLLAFVQPSVAGFFFHPTPSADFPTHFNMIFFLSFSLEGSGVAEEAGGCWSLSQLHSVHPRMSLQLIAGSYLSIWGFGPLLKTLISELNKIQFL